MRYLTRSQWGCKTPLGRPMRRPVSVVFIHHTDSRPTKDPTADARLVDRVGAQRFGQFPYSYLVHPSGVVLEGAGDRVGAHTAGQNSSAIGISFIGNYENSQPTEAAIRAAADLIRSLQAQGRLTRTCQLRPHSSVKNTACPGRNLRAAIPRILQASTSGPGSAPPAPAPVPRPSAPAPGDLRQLAAAVQAAKKKVLRRGDRGDSVRALQAVLISRGATQITADGIFGAKTEEVVKFVQRLGGLKADGIVGPATWKVIAP
jgi:hypothetical protein